MDYDIEGFKNYLYEEELSQNTIRLSGNSERKSV